MPKAGNYDYPSRDLDECIKFLEKTKDFKLLVFKRDSFAEAIGLSPKSGHFNLVIGSMALYGLIETGEGEIKITELGKTILYDEIEREEAKSKAVRNVVLFADIFKEFGRDPTDMQLRIFLKDRLNVDVSELSSLSSSLSKLLKKVAKYIKPANEIQTDEFAGGEYKKLLKGDAQAVDGAEQWVLIHPYGGAIKIVNERTYKSALNLLEELKDKYDPKKGKVVVSSNSADGSKTKND